MIRYWKLISIATVIVIVIGAFYIQSSMASIFPQFSFEKEGGNEEEVKKLTILGHYQEGNVGDYVQITEAGTIYASERSFIERLKRINGPSNPSDIHRLQKEYRSFMRSKRGDPDLFYEDQATLAYADIERESINNYPPTRGISLVFEVLDKESKEITSFEYKKDHNSHAYIEDVQVVNGFLKVIIRHYEIGSDIAHNVEEIHVYTFDLATETLVSDEMILSVPKSSDTSTSSSRIELTNLNDSNLNPQKYLLFMRDIYEEVVQENDSYSTDHKERELVIYNIATNEQEELSLAEEMPELNDFKPVSIDGSTIYFLTTTQNGVEVMPYHIDSKKLGTKLTFDLTTATAEGMDDSFTKIINDKIYIVHRSENMPTGSAIFIGDIKTEETLYKGMIAIKNPSTDQVDYNLYIQNIEVE